MFDRKFVKIRIFSFYIRIPNFSECPPISLYIAHVIFKIISSSPPPSFCLQNRNGKKNHNCNNRSHIVILALISLDLITLIYNILKTLPIYKMRRKIHRFLAYVLRMHNQPLKCLTVLGLQCLCKLYIIPPKFAFSAVALCFWGCFVFVSKSIFLLFLFYSRSSI